MNLISNAIKFTPFGGQIKITSKLLRSESDLLIKEPQFCKIMSQASGHTYLEVQVEDTGVGIKPEDLKKLFQLFGFLEANQQLNSKGIGLGLHISKKITNIFEGDIVCRSDYGSGTNFIFIVALGSKTGSGDQILTMNNRIMNPLQKKYNKIELKKLPTRLPTG